MRGGEENAARDEGGTSPTHRYFTFRTPPPVTAVALRALALTTRGVGRKVRLHFRRDILRSSEVIFGPVASA